MGCAKNPALNVGGEKRKIITKESSTGDRAVGKAKDTLISCPVEE